MTIQRNGFMAGKSYGCRPMLSIGTGVGKSIKIDCLYNTVFVCTHTDMDFHLMTRRRRDHGFLSGKNDLGRTPGNPCYQCRENLTDRRLFCTKAASDTRLDHTNFRRRNVQRISYDPSDMKRDLSGRNHRQSLKMVHITVGTEGLHHGLLICLCVVNLIYCIRTFFQHGIHITHFFYIGGTEITLIISAGRDRHIPVILRVHQNGIILGCVDIQNRFLHTIFYLNAFQGFIYCLFCLTGYDGNRIPYKTHMLIYDITIPWTDLRRCLPGQSKSFVGNILIGQNTGNPLDLLCSLCLDLFHPGIGMRTS